jgi:hypothetical protein
VIIQNFDILGSSFSPPENDPPLVVDSYGVLAGKIAFQGFKLVSRRDREIAKDDGIVKLDQLSARYLGEGLRNSLRNLAIRQNRFGELPFEAPDHIGNVSPNDTSSQCVLHANGILHRVTGRRPVRGI